MWLYTIEITHRCCKSKNGDRKVSCFFVRVIYNVFYERVYYKKRRGYGTDRRSYENSEKGVASGVISGYGTDRRSYEK